MKANLIKTSMYVLSTLFVVLVFRLSNAIPSNDSLFVRIDGLFLEVWNVSI